MINVKIKSPIHISIYDDSCWNKTSIHIPINDDLCSYYCPIHVPITMIHVEIITTCAVEITQYALKGQKLLAQGDALGDYGRQPVALKGQKH